MHVAFDAGHMWGVGGGWFGPWGLATIVLAVALIATVAWLVVRVTRTREPSALDQARAILAERYARGEIPTEEYRERLQALS